MATTNRKESWLVPVAGGLGLALIMIGAGVAHASVSTCQQCVQYWEYVGVFYTVADGGCKDYKSTNQGNNKNACIQNLINSHCKAICDADPVYIEGATCEGYGGIAAGCKAASEGGGDDCEDASGPCNEGCWGASCEGTSGEKTCKPVQVNQKCKKVMASPCYANCQCE